MAKRHLMLILIWMTDFEADRSFLTDGRPYLNSRQAALYVGHDPNNLGPFYDWTHRHGIKQTPGASLYRRRDLDAVIEGTQPAPVDPHARFREMAREDLRRGPRAVGRRAK